MNRNLRWLVIAAALTACEDQGPGDANPIPPPGPHFTHVPIPVESLARITPIGYNNKVFPVDHTYWLTCDIDIILQSSRPCVRQYLNLVAPGGGVVRAINPAADGFLAVEGPPGLRWTFGHVTPAPGLTVGATVTAGQVVATMFYNHGFDFGLINYGITHQYITPPRYPDGMLHGENPIAQYPDAVKALLFARVNSLTDSLGRLSFDAPGSASGAWFILGAPRNNVPLQVGNEHMLLWLAQYVERQYTGIVSVGALWAGMPNRLLAVDSAATVWASITPLSGPIAVKLWNIGTDARPDTTSPAGTLLVQLMDSVTLRAEWFNTHGTVTAFTAAARTYER